MNQKKILIAEDDALLRNALTDKLTREGFSVQIARNGEECLEKAFEIHPDLILLDVLMPKMDGVAVLSRLRSDPWGATAKVILLTNMTEMDKLAGASLYKSDGYLIKSDTKIGEVVAKIHEQLTTAVLTEHAHSPASDVKLPEHRCACGKLLFKGALLFSTVEIKCKRCGEIRRIDTADQKMLG